MAEDALSSEEIRKNLAADTRAFVQDLLDTRLNYSRETIDEATWLADPLDSILCRHEDQGTPTWVTLKVLDATRHLRIGHGVCNVCGRLYYWYQWKHQDSPS